VKIEVAAEQYDIRGRAACHGPCTLTGKYGRASIRGTMTNSRAMDAGRGRARPGRGLMRPPSLLQKVCAASGATLALSVQFPAPQSLLAIARPFGGNGKIRRYNSN